MPWKPRHCPYEGCENHEDPPGDFCRMRGTFPHKRTGKTVRRWQCKACGRTFSRQTESETRGQRRPDINRKLMDLLCSGVTLARAAVILGVTDGTIRRKFILLSEKARSEHVETLMNTDLLETSWVQFDELLTYLHTKAKPLTVAIAVRGKDGKMIAARAGRIPAFGKLAKTGQQKYGWTVSEKEQTCRKALREVEWVVREDVEIHCDGDPRYPQWIAEEIPRATVVAVARGGVGTGDPLFMLNHTCAKLRSDLSRLARRTWATTKSVEMLQRHLDLYIAWVNGYEV